MIMLPIEAPIFQEDEDVPEWGQMAPVLSSWKHVKSISRKEDNLSYFTGHMLDQCIQKHGNVLNISDEETKKSVLLQMDEEKWKETSHKETKPFVVTPGRFLRLNPDEASDPLVIFLSLFPDELFQMLISNTNDYASQKVRFSVES